MNFLIECLEYLENLHTFAEILNSINMRLQNHSSVLPLSLREAERVISAPQLGHVITPLCSGSKSSETDTPKAAAIFCKVSTVGFPLTARDKALSLMPMMADNSFAVNPLALISSLILSIFSYNQIS